MDVIWGVLEKWQFSDVACVVWCSSLDHTDGRTKPVNFMNIDQGNRGIRSYGANKLTSFGIFLVLRVRNPQIWSYQLGAYSEGGQGVHASPNRRLSGFLRKNIRLCLDQKCSVDLKCAKNALAAVAAPWTPLGKLTTLPRPPSRLGRGTHYNLHYCTSLQPARATLHGATWLACHDDDDDCH